MNESTVNKPITNRKNPGKGKSKALKISLLSITAAVMVIIAATATFIVFFKPKVDNKIPFDIDQPDGGDNKGGDPSADTTVPGNNYDPSMKGEIYNFMVLGMDAQSYLTDVIMVVSFNVTDHSMKIVQIPRDTYIDGHSANYTYKKYWMANKYDKDVALTKTADLLQKSLCIKIHYYALMELEGFRNIVDAIGGVNMYVPYDIYYSDPEQNLYINLKEGQQTLDGNKAEQFVRYRKGYAAADIARGNAQKLFMSAFFKQLKSSFNLKTVTNLVQQLVKYVTTDIPITDAAYFAKEALSVDPANISMVTMPGSGSYYIKRKAALQVVNEYLNIYKFEITDSIFDKDRMLASKDYMNIYNSKDDMTEGVTADDPSSITPELMG